MMYPANHFKPFGKDLIIDVIIECPHACPFETNDHLLEDRTKHIYLNEMFNKVHQDLFLLVLLYEYFMC